MSLVPKTRLRVPLLALTTLALLAIPHAAFAQQSIDPTATPVENNGGWVYWMAEGAIALGGLIALVAIASYLRFAPRFSRSEQTEGPRTGVKAPSPSSVRIQYRPQPAVAVAAPAVAAPAPVAAPAVAAPAPAPAPAPSQAAQAQEAPAQPQAAPAQAAEAAPAAPAAPREAEAPVELDQETFDRVLKEQLDKGTDRRVAEGRARSAAFKAGREKAGGE